MERAPVVSSRVIITARRHTQAAPLFSETYARLEKTIPPLAQTQVVVMGGFIGSAGAGVPTTPGRGGGQYTPCPPRRRVGPKELPDRTHGDGLPARRPPH